MKKSSEFGFADLSVRHRKVKETFFRQIDTLIDWSVIESVIDCYYNKCHHPVGRPGYSGLTLFKMTLLQTWYNLSDYEVEDQVNDRISFSRFVGISMDGSVPDHSVVSRFRSLLTKAKAYDHLLDLVNQQLEAHDILVRQGVIVDASVTESPRRPRGKKCYKVVEDRKEEESGVVETHLEESPCSHVDPDGRWLKKRGRLHFGFKQHTAVETNGLILGVITTSANLSDIKYLEDVLKRVAPSPKTWVKADKGYKSAENDTVLRSMRLRSHVMHKASKGHPLSTRAIALNKAISGTRYKVERTFGSMKRWFGAGKARYVGLEKMHTQHLMEAIAHNLYRAPGIAMSLCEE